MINTMRIILLAILTCTINTMFIPGTMINTIRIILLAIVTSAIHTMFITGTMIILFVLFDCLELLKLRLMKGRGHPQSHRLRPTSTPRAS